MKIMTVSISVFFIFLSCASLHADIAELRDTTILVGKVIKDESKNIVFKNSFGEFTIKRELIKKLFITKHYNEDIAIFRQLGRKADETVIKENYYAGLGEEAPGEKKKPSLKNENSSMLIMNNTNSEISFSSSYMFVTGKLNEVIENGFSFNIEYTAPPDILPGLKLRKWMPLITADLSYQHFQQENCRINGITILAGPSWNMSFWDKKYGSVKAGFLGGISAFAISGENSSTSTTTFTTEIFTGYSKSFHTFTVFTYLKYLYVYDRDIDLNSVGFSLGTGYMF